MSDYVDFTGENVSDAIYQVNESQDGAGMLDGAGGEVVPVVDI